MYAIALLVMVRSFMSCSTTAQVRYFNFGFDLCEQLTDLCNDACLSSCLCVLSALQFFDMMCTRFNYI